MNIHGPLPFPNSEELRLALGGRVLQLIYELAYDRRDYPPTMADFIEYVSRRTGKTDAHLNKRVREVGEVFLLKASRDPIRKKHVYPLLGWRPERTKRKSLSEAVRAQVLLPQRCAQCGKKPLEDDVKLEVDHKVPLDWGGTDELENLQPLCRACNGGKRAFFATFEEHADSIRAAGMHREVHVRIGETLKAFAAAGKEAPAQILGPVASLLQYQDDWQKRMRELRELDWDYTYRKRREDGRVHTYYRLVRWHPWPEGNIAAVIHQLEKARKENPIPAANSS